MVNILTWGKEERPNDGWKERKDSKERMKYRGRKKVKEKKKE